MNRRLLFPLLLVTFGPVFLFPSWFPRIFVLVMTGLLLITVIFSFFATRAFNSQSPIIIPIILFLLFVIPITGWISPFFWQLTWPKLTSLIWAIAIFGEVVSLSNYKAPHEENGIEKDTHPITWLTAIYLLLGLAFGTVGVFGLRTINKIPVVGEIAPHLPDFTSNILGLSDGIHANELAGTIILFLPPAIALTLFLFFQGSTFNNPARFHPGILLSNIKQRLVIVIFLLICLFLTAVLFLTQSRSGLLGFGLALVFMLSLMGRKGWIIIATSTIFAIVSIFMLGQTSLFAGVLFASSASIQYGPVGLRLEIWQRATQAATDFPWFGTGLGTFRQILNLFYPWPVPKGTEVAAPDLGHAHNLFLQTAVDFGIPAAFLFLIIIIGTIIMLARLLTSIPETTSDRFWVIGMAGALVAHLIYSLTDAVALGSKPGVGLWFLLGLITAAYNTKSQQPSASSSKSIWRQLTLCSAPVLIIGLLVWLGPPVSLNLALSNTAAALNGDPDSLSVAEERLAILAQDSCPANWYWGLILNEQGREQERDAAWSVLLTCSEDYIPYMAIQLPEHQPLAKFAVSVQPDSADAHFWFGKTLAIGSPEQAISQYKQGLALRSNDGLRWLELGDILVSADPQAALAAYVEACKNGDPAGRGCWQAGQTAESLGDISGAITYYRLSRVSRALERAEQLSNP